MSGSRDLHPCSPPPSATGVPPWVRWIGRTLGVLIGPAISAYGAGLYLWRCFDTCPADPAEDKISRLLTVSIVLVGLIVVTASACLGTRALRPGTWVVSILGAAIALVGAVTLVLVPALRAPGDDRGPLGFGLLALTVGAATALGSSRLRRRLDRPSSFA